MDPEALIDDDLNDEPAATMAGLRILSYWKIRKFIRRASSWS